MHKFEIYFTSGEMLECEMNITLETLAHKVAREKIVMFEGVIIVCKNIEFITEA
jgi:hypothetical protein